MATARDVKVFVPTRDLEISRAFYEELGWSTNWREGGLAELELAGCRMLLQDYYAKDWAENFMIQVIVDRARDWFDRATRLIASGRFDGVKAQEPKDETWGVVCYVWDPAGVLIHFTERKP